MHPPLSPPPPSPTQGPVIPWTTLWTVLLVPCTLPYHSPPHPPSPIQGPVIPWATLWTVLLALLSSALLAGGVALASMHSTTAMHQQIVQEYRKCECEPTIAPYPQPKPTAPLNMHTSPPPAFPAISLAVPPSALG